MAEQRANSGSLGKNRYKDNEKKPDLTGNIHVDRNLLIDLLTKHKDKPLIQLRLSAWNKQNNETGDRKSTRLNSSHLGISYAVFCLKKK